MDIKAVLMSNYLPYAKGTIVSRALPSIDGLKPSHRRILYTMYTMHLINGDKTKSSNIVGQTMKLHPHGDMSIYDTMVHMTTGNEALNVPYIESKGNFSKTYSKSIAYAASRYTEAKLAPISKEIFDGIDENGVIMVDNFDNTTKEPSLLPVKFPSILVNPSSGIAVGISSYIPSFSLKNVCLGTIGMVKGEITDVPELMEVLGVPEYSTGGFIHASKEDLIKLGTTGEGTFVFSGTVNTYTNKIEIVEIPYNTTAEDIISAIEENMKNGELKEVSEVIDEIDINGFKISVYLKKNANARNVVQKLCRLTPLRKTISFHTRVIIADTYKTLGMYDLLNYWIDFRLETIKRIAQFRKDKDIREEHLLEAWEKIGGNGKDIKQAALLITSSDDSVVKQKLMDTYGLDSDQADYLLDKQIRTLTTNNFLKSMQKLANCRQRIIENTEIIESDDAKKKIIVSDLTRIIKEYGSENHTHRADPIIDVPQEKEEVKVDDSPVKVLLTKSGFLKRLATMRDLTSYRLPDGEEIDREFNCKNNDHILVFTYDGTVHKIAVSDIDSSRSGIKDEVYKLAGLMSSKEILLIDIAGDYNKYFNLVYPNGRGMRVYYDRAKGKRKQYKGLFDKCEPGQAWITFSDQFFMLTYRRKAAFTNLELMGMLSRRVAFKVARVGRGDHIVALHNLEDVPDVSKIDLDKYRKDYTVCINDDVLWESEKKDDTEESEENTEQDADNGTEVVVGND